MADYKTQIEGLTGLSIGTTPTNDEVSQFLVDGTTEVANRIIVLNPADMSKFCETTNSTTSVVKTGRILSVMREHDSTTVLRSCVPISPESRYDATDLESLNFRSKFNPAFYELDGVIHSIPAATSGNNDIVVTQVYYATNTGHSSSSIQNFPYEYEYLVVLYASVKSLQNALSNKDNDLPSDLIIPILSDVSTSLPTYSGPTSYVMPVAPPGVDVDFSSIGDVTNYIAPVLSISTTPTITDLTISTSSPVVPGLTSSVISESGITAPTFTPPVMGELDFSDTNNWISSEEDSEMLAARVNEISTKIQEHQARLQESVSIFQKDNTIFQKDLQIAITNAQLESENDSQKIQAYGQEVQNYAASINKEVQEYQINLEGDLRVWESERNHQLTTYGTDIQNESSRVSASLQNYQTKINKAISQYQSETGYDMSKYQNEIQTSISKFESDLTLNSTDFQNNLGKYSAEVNKISSDNQMLIVKYQHQVTDYINKLQKVQASYEWMMGRLTMLQQQYDTSFSIMAPKQQQQGEQ